MEISQLRERLSTKSTTPDDDVFSTPTSASFFRRSLLSTPRIDSTPPTSDFVSSGQNTPVPYRRRTPIKSLIAPWGIGVDNEGIKLETTPPPSSQLPAAYDLSPTPAPKSKRGAPNAVKAPPCCQVTLNSARKLIESSDALSTPAPTLSPDESPNEPATSTALYDRWATVVRTALMNNNMWKFVDGSHQGHSSTIFYRTADAKTADLIAWAYIEKFPPSPPSDRPVLDATVIHLPASALWDHIRAKHTRVPPEPSWLSSSSSSSSMATTDTDSQLLPPVSSAASLLLQQRGNFSEDVSRVLFLQSRFYDTTLDAMGCDVALFADQLQGLAFRSERFGFPIHECLVKCQFLRHLSPEYGDRVRRLEAAYGPRLWAADGVGFAEVREWMVEEERRLREAEVVREREEVVRVELARLEEEREDGFGMARVSEEGRLRAEAAEGRLRAAMLTEPPEVEFGVLKEIQESIEASEEDAGLEDEEEQRSECRKVEEPEDVDPLKKVLEIKDSQDDGTEGEEVDKEEVSEEVDEEKDKEEGELGLEHALGLPMREILQVKDTDAESDEDSVDEEEVDRFVATIARPPATPNRTEKQATPVEKVQETPVAPASTRPQPSPEFEQRLLATAAPSTPARVLQTLGSTPTPRRPSIASLASAYSSSTPEPHARVDTAPPSSPPARPTFTAATSRPWRSPSPDPNDPYSDPEATLKAVQRARGNRSGGSNSSNKKERRERQKKEQKRAKKALKRNAATDASGALLSSSSSVNTPEKRKTVAEANEVFDREYRVAIPLTTKASCHRCKKTGHSSECQCPWSPAVMREKGKLRSVAWTRVPVVEFKLERKERVREEGNKENCAGEDEEQRRKTERKERKKEKKRKRKESEGEGDMVVKRKKKADRTPRRSSLSL